MAGWMDDVECYGNESLLIDCEHAGLGINDCNREEVAEVTCLGVYYITLYNQNTAPCLHVQYNYIRSRNVSLAHIVVHMLGRLSPSCLEL